MARQQQQNRHSIIDDELHAFDLTWRNYLPSVSTFCCFNRGIRLEDTDDTVIEPAYYNDHTLYRGEALQNYLDNSRDWEFDSVLGQNDELPQFVTRNPFGTASIKKKKSKSKKNKKKRERPVVMETDLEEGDTIVGYDIEDNQAYYHDDAEFLGDDQIASLAYNRNSSQVMDQYGEELYYQHVQGPTVQEMQPPPPPTQFYAARSMPVMNFDDKGEEQNYDDYEERVVTVPGPSTVKPQASIEAAQALLSERLDDLTEKLAFIKNNIIHIQPPATQEDEIDDSDRNTLHTIKKHSEDDQNSMSSDIDSITSEALNVYENTATTYENNVQQSSSSRYSTGDELHIPSLVDNTPFVSDQHPFTYFNEDNNQYDNEDNTEQQARDEETDQILNVRNIVFDFGKKWLGV